MKLFSLYAAVLFLSAVGSLMASTFSGTVRDLETNKPVSGVRVSVGFTDTVTYTDINGWFSFSDGSDVKRMRPSGKPESILIRKISGGSAIDLRHCESINRIELFDLKGRSLFKTDVPNSRRIILLSVSNGMYLIQFLKGSSAVYTLKWNSINLSQHATLPSFLRQKQFTAAASGSRKFVFQHDFYYPLYLEEGPSPQTILMEPDPRAAVFDDTKIGRYDFVLANQDSLSMEQNALLEEYVPADFFYNQVHFGTVGLRYKGSTYSLPNCFETAGTRKDKSECRKISFKVKFDKYNPDLRFNRLKKLNLHSESIDPSKMHDILAYGLFREMGIIAPRCSFAKVYLNNVFQGLYCAVEDVDGRFTAARWPGDGDGNVYKEKWPISASPSYYQWGLVTNDDPEDSADVSKMVQFYEAVNSSDESTFKDLVSPFWDFDYWLRYIAVDRVIHNTDGVMTWYKQDDWTGNHNYYLYQQNAADGKIWIVPWDLHVTFGRKDEIFDVFGVPDWNVEPPNCEPVTIWGNQSGIPPNCDKLTHLTAAVFWDEFVKISENMLRTCFDPAHLQSKIERYKNLIDTVVQNDPHISYDSWLGQVSALRNDITILNTDFDDYIHGRSFVNDTSDFLTPFNGSGYLTLDQLNNYESEPTEKENRWSSIMAATNTIVTVKRDTINPLWGKSDLLYSFVFNPEPGKGTYLEWGKIVLGFEEPVDLSKLKAIQVNVNSDSYRYLWVFISSPVYYKNRVNYEYGWWDAATPEKAFKTYTINSAGYPSWADDNPPDLKEEALKRVTGIGFQANPHYSNDGELASAPDSGFVRIDNIRFVF